MSVNSFLLSIFASRTRFRGDVNSMAIRFQVLSIIYINLVVFGIVFGYELSAFFTIERHNFFLTSVLLTALAVSFWSLHTERWDWASTIVVIYLGFVNFSGATGLNIPLGAVTGLFLHPIMGFFLSPALKPRIINIVLCMSQLSYYIYKIKAMFKVTLTDEQALQIETFSQIAFNNLLFLCILTFVQKSLEAGLWKMIHESNERAEKLTKEVVQAAEAKDKFVSSLSHEIRNPLNALKGSIDYLLTVIRDPNHLKILESAKISSDVLINLANNVLDAAKLRSEKMDVSYAESSFPDTLKKVLVINSENLKARKVKAKAIIDRALTEKMWIDPSRLLQIMMNLVSNALKFTPEGGQIKIKATWCDEDSDKEMLLQPSDTAQSLGHLKSLAYIHSTMLSERENSRRTMEDSIYEEFDSECDSRFRNFELMQVRKTNTLEERNHFNSKTYICEPWNINYFVSEPLLSHREKGKKGYLKVEVSDTGCGIAPENIPKLFEMFVQAHKSVTAMHGGTGLGLWICKQLCQKMGGDIKLYSEVKKGTTFVFYIPVNNDRQDRAIPINQGPVRESVNVMVVDDYAHNRDLHRLLLEREGAKVVTASNGREAVEKYKLAEEGHFDFILMDVLMPEIDGFEAARMIKKWEMDTGRKKKVDICFVSGEYFNEEEVMSAFKQIGGKEIVTGIRCLKKPVDIEMIRKVVEEYKRLCS